MKKKSEFDTYQGNLRFDNLNFKLAVLQHLIFEKKVFSPKYDFGDVEKMYYEDGYSSEKYEQALEAYRQEALQFFTYLKVPADLVKHVTQLQIEAGDDIYFEINPQWNGQDSFFDINKISDREIAQFPKLKKISFWYMSNNVEALKKQLKKHHVKVELGGKGNQKSNQKSISPVIALLYILVAAVGTGGLAGSVFRNQYKDIEVTWSNEAEETSEEMVEEQNETTEDSTNE